MVYKSLLPSPLLVIVGETGSGKSQLALELAQLFNGEIISADSWAVYRGFDIGTAKPTKTQRQTVPHHLIDVADARTGFNAALYQKLANQAIVEIADSGRLPILVGGTGLYVDSVIYGFSFLPTVSPEERVRRNSQTLTDLLAEAEVNGISLDDIDTRNKRRVIRALETGGQHPTNTTVRSNTLILGVRIQRDNLRQQITDRVNKMLAAGLEHEVQQLYKQYGWEAEPMKGIGYREWREYFEGSQNLELTVERIISATMQLAKRQQTWFKRNKSIQWVDDPRTAVDLATTFLNKKQ